MQQVNLDKTRLGFQTGVCLDKNVKEENKEVKVDIEKKSKMRSNPEIRNQMQ